MLDIDTTVKTVFGHQEGAEVGYNPHKPGRPTHACHTYWIARLRLCLDVEVRPGKQSSSSHGMPALWELIDSLPRECRPHGIRGDCNHGNEANMVECEKRGIPYPFKLRQTAKVKNLISLLEQKGGWVDCAQGFEGIEGEVRLSGWSCKRRVIVARRLVKQEATEDDKKALPLLTQNGELPLEVVSYEHIVLVSTLPYEVASLVPLYRERGDAENPFDELKNQWGWAGFTTQDMDRCQITARLIAQIYNWWSLYARLVDRERHREAVTTRPELLGGVARQTRHAGQTRINMSLSHSKIGRIKEKLAEASAFLQGLITTAEQLTRTGKPSRFLNDEGWQVRTRQPLESAQRSGGVSGDGMLERADGVTREVCPRAEQSATPGTTLETGKAEAARAGVGVLHSSEEAPENGVERAEPVGTGETDCRQAAPKGARSAGARSINAGQ